MKITTIGRGTVGGTLARLWTSAGHDVTELGQGGGDAADADVVLLAVPYSAAVDAVTTVTGLEGKVVIDATNSFGGEPTPVGYASVSEYIQATTNGPVAKGFNLNFSKLFDQAAAASTRPDNIWVGDEGARAAVEQLSRDIGMRALNGGPLRHAATLEGFANVLMAIVKDGDDGLVFYRFAAPEKF